MNLRQKTLLTIALCLCGLIAVLSGSLSLIMLRSFDELEREEAERDVERVHQAIAADIDQLRRLSIDWGAWDDTHSYVLGNNPSYVADNFGSATTLADLDLDLFVISDRQGKIHFSQGFDRVTKREITLSPTLTSYLQPPAPLTTPSSGKLYNRHGLLRLPWQTATPTAMLMAAQGIIANDHQGPPQGQLIMARRLQGAQVAELEERTQLEIEFYDLATEVPKDLASVVADLEAAAPDVPALIIKVQDRQTLMAYSLLRDFTGEPILLMALALPRLIYQEGQRALGYLAMLLVAVGLGFGAVTLCLLEKMVLARLARLIGEVRQIGHGEAFNQRVTIQGKDELSDLAITMNQMLGRLAGAMTDLADEQAKAERLLTNILPAQIATQLKENGQVIAENFEAVTILFADLVNFTQLASHYSAVELVKLLNEIFSQFDHQVEALGLEKIKTIGDAYMVAAGLPVPREDHAAAIADMALAMQTIIANFNPLTPKPLQLRIGINTGVAVAGVIGTKKFIYDLWGDAVNIAARMESHGEPGKIQVTQATYEHLKENYHLEERGVIDIKGKGPTLTYWLLGRKLSGERREIDSFFTP